MSFVLAICHAWALPLRVTVFVSPRALSLSPFFIPSQFPWVRLDAALATEQHQSMRLPDMLDEALQRWVWRAQETRTGEDVPVGQLLWRLDSFMGDASKLLALVDGAITLRSDGEVVRRENLFIMCNTAEISKSGIQSQRSQRSTT